MVSRICWLSFGVSCLGFLFLAFSGFAFAEDENCDTRSCYPATGNLLIGRQHRLRASSTCGSLHPERYCIVSHLEDPKKCFFCDSRKPYTVENRDRVRSHRIENVVNERYDLRMKKWWQAENGVQNVSVRLDLEAEFHFTHLIITFKTFRPAAMLIERSSDFGKTWKIYRYFAYDCGESFPHIALAPPKTHKDVVCDSAYSNVAPSTMGEVVFRVLPPHIPLADPYHPDIQDLLKVTNIRINFTKLHTLGDNLLDNRREITEKYYYSVYDMVVRGSCQCYGHASRCIPIGDNGVGGIYSRDPRDFNANPDPDMVHGRCECTHHTKGLNCEQCEDFFNDLPWRPAYQTERSECKRCNCNSHAARCHFDRAVFEASGFVSGGVCDECQHNTMGKNCEQCKPYFYRTPGRDIADPYACTPCECDLRGALSQGICDSETDEEHNLVAGRCHCKQNVAGDNCDRCKHGFWKLNQDNPLGCTQCTCALLGTVGNEGCDKQTGTCTCKRLVTGENCDKCLPQHWGLSEEIEGCKACECDPGGAYDNDCDIVSGQCRCRPHFSNRRCDQPESGFFCANADHFTYEAETATLEKGAVVELREPHSDGSRTWTGTGFVRIHEGSQIKFSVDNIAVSMMYSIIIRFESQLLAAWHNVSVTLIRRDVPSETGPCHGVMPNDDFLQAYLQPGGRYYEVQPAVCLEAQEHYDVLLTFNELYEGRPDRAATLLIDSIVLTPPTSALPVFQGATARNARDDYERFQCRHYALDLTPLTHIPEVCKKYFCSVAAVMIDRGLECNCDPTGSSSGICSVEGGQCTCKPNVIGRRCNQCAPGTYGFGPQGCTACECNSIGSLDNFCDLRTGQCKCNENVYGRRCDQCEPGFWHFPNCEPCTCNGHADICEQQTGACIQCRDLTAGPNCDRCQDGYYGDPRIGVGMPCRQCPCPGGPGSGKIHADTCYLNPSTQDVVCNCRDGYEGARCDQCAMNYWGNPNEVGGSCERCDCNKNIDLNVPESCDAKTGRCLKCLHNTEGFQCENCVLGFFGDAKTQSCHQCVCNRLGTNESAGACDRVSGQCPCLPNVIGVECDQCAKNHWKIASGTGCDNCDCDPLGVRSDENEQPILQCNQFDGQCPCKPGRGGRTCGECEDYYWGNPRVECLRCECNPVGSSTLQCHRENGTCTCQPGSGGPNCDQCERGYTGQWPYCQPCGECFLNWDRVLQELKDKTKRLVHEASNIQDTGVTSVYDKEFSIMDEQLRKMDESLKSANVSKKELDKLKATIETLKSDIEASRERLNKVDSRITDVSNKVDIEVQALNSLRESANALAQSTATLEQNATRLKEADVEGAFNITKEAAEESYRAEQRALKTDPVVDHSETARRNAKEILDANKEDFDQQFKENQDALGEIDQKLATLESQIPDVNLMVCGGKGDPCHDSCGGAGCGTCGGISCGEGAVTKSGLALKYAEEANDLLKTKQNEANALLQKVREAHNHSEVALREAKGALDATQRTAKVANETRLELESLLARLRGHLSGDGSDPSQIRTLAEEILNTSISLTPEQIRKLADQIDSTLQKLTNIDAVIRETRGNLSEAQRLKDKAEQANKALHQCKLDLHGMTRAETVLATTTKVIEALNKAKEAQESALTAIKDAGNDITTTEGDLITIADEAQQADGLAKQSEESLGGLRKSLDEVKVDYLQIKKDVERATEVVDSASQAADKAAQKQKQLEAMYEQANTKLSDNRGQTEDPKERAEKLRQSATKLVEQTQKKLADIEQLKRVIGVNEVDITNMDSSLQNLISDADRWTDELNRYFHASTLCQCQGVVKDPVESPHLCPLDLTIASRLRLSP